MSKKGDHAPFPTIGLSELEIIREKTHAITGGRLIVARLASEWVRAQGQNLRAEFMTSWVPAWRKNIPVPHAYTTQRFAIRRFDVLKKSPPPVSGDMIRDWQAKNVYDWEDSHSLALSNAVDEKSIERITQGISRRFGIAAPDCKFRPEHFKGDAKGVYRGLLTDGSKMKSPEMEVYIPASHVVIHEMVHHIDTQVNKNRWLNHGPSFARTLITVLRDVVDEEMMEETAEDRSITVAHEHVLPIANYL